MKKTIFFLISLSLFAIISVGASAALLDNSALETMAGNADTVRATSGLGETSVGEIIAAVIQAALGLLGVIFLVLMVLAGFNWMTANGDEKKVEKATGTIKTAVIGLIIVLASYAITYFIFRYLPFSSTGSQVIVS